MKKIGILLAILLIAGVCAMADEAIAMQGDALFADVDAVALSQAEMQAVDGGYDPDAGGNNWHYNRRDIERTAAYLDQRSKITVSVSVVPRQHVVPLCGQLTYHLSPGAPANLRRTAMPDVAARHAA
jgi:hypothetical protein